MSLLVVAFVPGLMMLAALGLARLETRLTGEAVTGRDVADFLRQAQPVDVGTLARVGMPEALSDLHRRRSERIIEDGVVGPAAARPPDRPGIPGRIGSSATRRINRV